MLGVVLLLHPFNDHTAGVRGLFAVIIGLVLDDDIGQDRDDICDFHLLEELCSLMGLNFYQNSPNHFFYC